MTLLIPMGDSQLTKFLGICLGGAVGTGARYLLSGWVLQIMGTSFPYGTLAVNIVGSFLIGVVMRLGLTTEIFSPTLRLILVTGVLGGFTTYSSFNYETIHYFHEGNVSRGLMNLFAMTIACLAAGLLGLAAAKRLTGS